MTTLLLVLLLLTNGADPCVEVPAAPAAPPPAPGSAAAPAPGAPGASARFPHVAAEPQVTAHAPRAHGVPLAARQLPLPLPSPADEEPPGPPTRPTKFHNLRFEEDWRWLGEPGARTDHWFAGAKHVPLGGGWSASFGGQVRDRVHFESNRALTGVSPEHNTFNLTRVRAHADLRHEDGYRIFFEGIDARIFGESRPPLGIDRNHSDVQNLFVEAGGDDVLFRLGRMELQEGAQRLVSPLDWGNTRRTFQGGLLRLQDDTYRTDVFLTKPVITDAQHSDDTDHSRWFGGIWHGMQLEGGQGLDLFGLVLDEEDALFTAGDGKPGDLDLFTVGARFTGKEGDSDYELWAAQQFGRYSGDQVDAWAATAVVGHTFPALPGDPRVGLEVDYASGDSNPTDSEFQTFNQLYPLAHAYLGLFDLVARQNILDLQGNLAVKVAERATAGVAFHYFRLAEEEDSLYSASGAPTFTDPTGSSGDDVGKEIDLTLSYVPEFLAPHGHVLIGWSHFFPGNYVDSLGSDDDADLFYTQFTMTF